MKLKDILSVSENKKNKQLIWNPKKKEIKKAGLSMKDILNIEVKKKMNKKGQATIIFGMMLGLVIILLGLYLAPSVTEFTNSTMTTLDCSNSSINNYYKATCTALDVGSFWFIGAIILIGGGFFVIKIIF